jgi:hypothetical protein
VVHAGNSSTQKAEAGRLNLRPAWATKQEAVSKKKKNQFKGHERRTASLGKVS